MLKKYLIRIGLLILSGVFFLFFPVVGLAKDTSLPVLNTKTKNIAVFKNGLGFFMREGTVRLNDGWAVTEYVPNASLGSLWIGSLDRDSILEEVIGFKEDVQRSFEAISIEELLASNIGKKVKITYSDKIIEGTIKSVPEAREPEKGEGSRIDYTRNVYDPRLQPKLAAIVIIDTGDGEVVLNKSNISKVEFPKDFYASYLSKEKAKRIKFKLATSKKEAKLALSYLQKGISWVPSYLINLEDSKKARITMKATLINDVEDLDNVDFFFVVGYPNFLYADVLSPMALEESITQFIQSLRREGRQEDAGGMMAITRQRADFRESGTLSNLDYGYETIKGLPGAAEEDLFLYHKEKIGIKKGERAYYPIFFDEVDYKHIYEWEIPDTINVDPRGYQRSEQEKKEKEQVWHSVKLSNSTKYPWTTAPAFVVSGWKPLAQDTINYTPKNAKTNLKLTVATDVKHDRHEFEMDRQRDVKIYTHNYDLVTVKGELSIKNHKNKEITMEIKKRLTGEVTEASHNGKIEKVAEGLRGVNQNSSISWEIPVKAGEEINATYKYKVYITR
jgi:transcriptional/translational regulatory protein YebC/TACO1